jgi:4-alpha-glucanotransferase
VVALREDCGFPGMKILQFGFGTDATDEFLPHNWRQLRGLHRHPRQRHRARLVATASDAERPLPAATWPPATHDIHWA